MLIHIIQLKQVLNLVLIYLELVDTYNDAGICYKLESSAGDPDTGDTLSHTTSRRNLIQKYRSRQGQLYKSRAYIIDAVNGTTYSDTVLTTQLLGFTNPTNAYSSDDSYSTISSTDGKLDVQLSVNNGI